MNAQSNLQEEPHPVLEGLLLVLALVENVRHYGHYALLSFLSDGAFCCLTCLWTCCDLSFSDLWNGCDFDLSFLNPGVAP